MNFSIREIYITIAICCATLSTSAMTPAEVESAVNAAKEAPKNQILNREAANALKESGRFVEAIPFYLKGGNSGNLGIAESYFYLYNFDKAEEYLDKYLEKRSKADEAKDNEFSYGDENSTTDWTEHLRSRIELGRSMLDRVEKIQIIDSINVASDVFFKYMKLAGSAGHLVDQDEIERLVSKEYLDSFGIASILAPAYISESGDDMIWYGSSHDGDAQMFESIRLADGSWDKPTKLFDYASMFGDKNGSWVSYPFLMSDGVTLYFAADGDKSLGELDIFISRRDEDGFLQPSNIGMPYNSPYNDYLYAIDEVTGAGWWVSDRNMIKDSVTVYTFIPQELRINYPVDTPGLVNYAKISSIKITQDANTDYEAFRKRIANISDEKNTKSENQFELALPGGKILHRFTEFNNPEAAETMKQYLAEQKSFAELKNRLSTLRGDYGSGNKSVGSEILDIEKLIENKRIEIKRLRNSIVNLESQ